jgi:hypothetical protein
MSPKGANARRKAFYMGTGAVHSLRANSNRPPKTRKGEAITAERLFMYPRASSPLAILPVERVSLLR